MKERTAWRRLCSLEAAWEAETPPSLSESPSEDGHNSGLDLTGKKDHVDLKEKSTQCCWCCVKKD